MHLLWERKQLLTISVSCEESLVVMHQSPEKLTGSDYIFKDCRPSSLSRNARGGWIFILGFDKTSVFNIY